MAMESRRVQVRSRRAITDNDISEVLNDSEFDFSGDDSDEDPEFIPPELTQRASGRRTSESSSSEEEDGLLVSPAASPVLSDSSDLPLSRSRGRGRSLSRGRGRGRGRGRSLSLATRQIAIRNRQNNDGIQDAWTRNTLEPEISDLVQPAYIHRDTENWDWYKFYDQYIDDDILKTIVNCTNRSQSHILATGKSMGLTLRELKTYLGITMLMSALQYPQSDMYWSEKWKVPVIAKAMTRNRFFFIRSRLKCVYDPEVTAEDHAQSELLF